MAQALLAEASTATISDAMLRPGGRGGVFFWLEEAIRKLVSHIGDVFRRGKKPLSAIHTFLSSVSRAAAAAVIGLILRKTEGNSPVDVCLEDLTTIPYHLARQFQTYLDHLP